MTDLQKYFPNNSIQNIMDDLLNVNSWEDFQRRFLLGTGKATNTNLTYLTACRQFYEFTGGLHPMQAGTPEWIEQFYDSLPADLGTRAVKIAGLKFMYKKIGERIPAYQSPFAIMSKGLQEKLNRTKKDESEKGSLTKKEYRDLLTMLAKDKSIKGLQNYSFIRFAVSSGMRAAELVSLKYGNLSESEGVIKATFTGKGSKVRTIQLEPAAVEACRRAFRARFNRRPGAEDYLFNALNTGGNVSGITKSALHRRIVAIIATGKGYNIIRQNLAVSTHTMRHTCATLLIESGIPIDAVQRHLGHSSIATTSIYLHSQVNIREVWEKVTGAAA